MRSLPNYLLNGPYSDEKSPGMLSKRDELVMQTKLSCSLVNRFRDYTDRGDLRCVLPTPIKRVHEEQPSNLLSLAVPADRESAQQRCRNQRIPGQLFGQIGRKFRAPDAISGKSIVAGNPVLSIHHHEGGRYFSFGVLACLPVEIIVQFRNPAGERCFVMIREALKGIERGRGHFIDLWRACSAGLLLVERRLVQRG